MGVALGISGFEWSGRLDAELVKIRATPDYASFVALPPIVQEGYAGQKIERAFLLGTISNLVE